MSPLQSQIVSLLLSILLYLSVSDIIEYNIIPDDPDGPLFIRDKSLNDTFLFQFAHQ